jgi:DnaJ-class molecular chaperone
MTISAKLKVGEDGLCEGGFLASRMTRCPTCLGIGTVRPARVCPTCNGKGTVDEWSQAQQRKGTAMAHPKTVITISRNEPLQKTRTALLNHAGYSVIALTTDEEVIKFLSEEGDASIN